MNRGLGGILCVLLAAGAARADRYVVEPGTEGVTPGNGYTNWACASTNIQLAVNEASAPETVWISNGTYYATGGTMVSISMGITLRGFSGNPADVTLDGRYPDLTNRLVALSHSNAALSSVTLRHGATTGSGGGATIAKNALITNCVIVSNISLLNYESFGGGGVYMDTGGSIRNSTISGNSCPYAPSLGYGAAGGVCIRESALLQDCIVSNNITSKTGGGITYKKWGTDTYEGVQILGCTITGNSVISNMGNSGGGGIWGDGKGCTLSHCVIRGNEATNSSSSGGGLFRVNAKLAGPVLICDNRGYVGGGLATCVIASDKPEDCVISNNTALSYGGGLDRYSGHIRNMTILDNVAGSYGGGIVLRGDASYTGKYDFVVSNCIVRGNQAKGASAGSGGGGIFFLYGAVVSECRIVGNTAAAGAGGGVAFFRNSAHNELRNCLVADNSSSTNGAGIYIGGGGVVLSSTLAGNSAAGRGGGVYAAGTTYVTNSVIAANTATRGGNDVYHYTAANSNNYGYCCVPEGITPENHNLLADPGFADAGAGNYQLSAGSRCRDAGLVDPWMDGMLDQAGRPRVDRLTGLVDMGCYEYLQAISLVTLR